MSDTYKLSDLLHESERGISFIDENIKIEDITAGQLYRLNPYLESCRSESTYKAVQTLEELMKRRLDNEIKILKSL